MRYLKQKLGISRKIVDIIGRLQKSDEFLRTTGKGVK